MKNYLVRHYQETDYAKWNDFVELSKNGTFLFHRDFMEYHKNQFEDFSLLVYKKYRLVAILPANRVGNSVYSHQGLTYGGLIYSYKISQAAIIEIFKEVLIYLESCHINTITIKTIPNLYHKQPADELHYPLFLAKAKLIRRDSLSVIDLKNGYTFPKTRRSTAQKAKQKGLICEEETQFDSFWNDVLIPNLALRHNAKPVHSLEEISYLKSKFDPNIRQFNVYYQDKIIAGATIFETETVAHCQYISKFENGENLGSLDFLMHHLINTVFIDKKFFDFGSSNEVQGTKLNRGLSFWKESFGANTLVQDFYEIETGNYPQLENVFL